MQTGVRKLEFSELTSNKSHSNNQNLVSKLEFLIKSKFLGVSKLLLLLNLIPYTKFIIFSHIDSEKSNL